MVHVHGQSMTGYCNECLVSVDDCFLEGKVTDNNQQAQGYDQYQYDSSHYQLLIGTREQPATAYQLYTANMGING